VIKADGKAFDEYERLRNEHLEDFLAGFLQISSPRLITTLDKNACSDEKLFQPKTLDNTMFLHHVMHTGQRTL